MSVPVLSNVSASVTSVQLAAANPARKNLLIYNDSSSVCYLKFGTAATSTSFTLKLPASSYYETPQPVYTGVVCGAWVTATGAARITERVG